MPGQPVAFGSFLLHPDNGTLFRDGELIAIGQRGALLLGALLKDPGQVRTKAELMDAVWPGTAVEESNLSVQIAALRKLLGRGPDGGEWIATVPRVGYRFVGQVGAAAATKLNAARAEPVIPSLAVLAFQNLSGDANRTISRMGLSTTSSRHFPASGALQSSPAIRASSTKAAPSTCGRWRTSLAFATCSKAAYVVPATGYTSRRN
jgi:DNA-binding winged helix-turn-helix (wHTH) protein